jgi:futalosine hydrolase
VATAYWCARCLARTSYDLVLNAGVCGSFSPDLVPGAAAHVVRDRVADLGAEDGDGFLTVQDLGLLGPDDFPYRDGVLVNTQPPAIEALASLPAVSGITVNRVHGEVHSIAEVSARFRPDVESMEGAAFMYACLVEGVPFAQVRTVSNVVERRNRASWKMREAVEELSNTVLRIVDQA